LSTDVSEPRAASIIKAMMMETARTSETSADNYFTRQYIPEDKSEFLDKFLLLLYQVYLLVTATELWWGDQE
jgi:3-deoxy-D-manno-octulosonic-acid transferase